MNIKEDILGWVSELRKTIDGNISASVIQTLPDLDKKYTLNTIYKEFGTYNKFANEAKITSKIIKDLPDASDVIEWLKEVDKECSPVTISYITTLRKKNPEFGKYNIWHINNIFGCLSVALEEAELPIYNRRYKKHTLINRCTTNMYKLPNSNIINNRKKRSKICKYLRIKYDINRDTELSSKCKKYTTSNYINKYFSSSVEAYDMAEVDVEKYKIAISLRELYNIIGEPITEDTPDLPMEEVISIFGNLKNALEYAELYDMKFSLICHVCKKEFSNKINQLLCKSCRAISSHSAKVNDNHLKSFKYISNKQVEFVNTLVDKYKDTDIEILKWDNYFNFNGALWDATIIIPEKRWALHWYNITSKGTPQHKFRNWLIRKQYKLSLIHI